LVPRLVDRGQLPNALSLYATVWQVATIAGPALARRAARLERTDRDLPSRRAFFGAGDRRAARDEAPPRGLGKSQISAKAALDGLRFIRSTPLIWSTMLLDFAATFFAGSMLLLRSSPTSCCTSARAGWGFLYAAQPAGAALTGAALSAFPLPRRQGAAMLWAVALYGAQSRVFGISPWFWLSFLMLALSARRTP